jgi:hypothetical protein
VRRYPLIAVLVFSLGLAALGHPQRIIENPAKALSPKAGRIVAVEEVMRIEDTGQGYYFKDVYGIRVSPGGEIFVRSGLDQVLQFDPQGHFVRDLVKKGQGPGEVTSVSDVFAAADRVYLLGSRGKILAFDLEGRRLDEISLREAGGHVTRIINADAGTILATRGHSPESREAGLVQVPEDVVEVQPGGRDVRLVGSFPLPYFAFAMDNGQWAVGRNASLIAAHFKDRQLFLSHTPEYLIKLFDAGTGKVVRSFRREYPRVRRVVSRDTTGDPEPSWARTWKDLIPKDLNDINDLHVVDGRLWVQTSTSDPEKGVLFDVFDPAGHFEDSFFLKWWREKPAGANARDRFTFAGGFVYISDTTEDGLIVIRKCRLLL